MIPNPYFNQSSQMQSIFEPSLFPPMPISTYPEYFVNNYQISNNSIPYQPFQEPIVRTIKIHVNPFFRPSLSNQMNPSSSSQSEPQVHNSSNSSTSRSRSSSTDRQVVRTTTKNQQERLNRKAQRERFIREKELIFKRQSTSISKSKSHRPLSNSKESKEEKFQRLYDQYSNEDMFNHWQPLLSNDCFELYQYAYKKYYGTNSFDC